MDRKPRTPEEILEYRKRWFRLTGIIAATLWLLWFVFAIMLAFFTADEPIARFGQVGDAFGSLNAIFGGAGFLGLLYTIYRQHLDTLEAEQRRRDDKKEEDAARTEAERLRREDKEREEAARQEADRRHAEDLKAQERITRVQGFTTLLNFDNLRLQKLVDAIQFIDNCHHLVLQARRGVGTAQIQFALTELEGERRSTVQHISLARSVQFQSLHAEFVSSLRAYAEASRTSSRAEESKLEASTETMNAFIKFLQETNQSLTDEKEGLLDHLFLYRDEIAKLLDGTKAAPTE
jgi:hypothetical protein